jgi:hypothetical protein
VCKLLIISGIASLNSLFDYDCSRQPAERLTSLCRPRLIHRLKAKMIELTNDSNDSCSWLKLKTIILSFLLYFPFYHCCFLFSFSPSFSLSLPLSLLTKSNDETVSDVWIYWRPEIVMILKLAEHTYNNVCTHRVVMCLFSVCVLLS